MKHYTVSSTREAWDLANKLFPFDYMKDDMASQNAGYPIYYATTKEYPYNNYHISDLNTGLELNMWTEETVRIWIEEPKTIEGQMKASGLKKNALGIWVAA